MAFVIVTLWACRAYDSELLTQTHAPAVQSGCDGDCAPACGDGIVDNRAGESCDPGSAEGACPVTCDDDYACTVDVMLGSAETCDATCLYTAVVAPRDGDDCCPEGATGLSDSDCEAICGNLVVESGERCDPCPRSCDDHDACTRDDKSGSAASCDLDCSHVTISARLDGDGCCPAGTDAAGDADCDGCGNGVVDSGEECDGGASCSRACKRVFHAALVHRYTFDGTGADVMDSAGDEHGTVINTALAGNGTLRLAGGTSNQYVDLPGGLISGLTSVTVEAWLEWDGGANRQRIFDFGMNPNPEFGSSTGEGTSYFSVSPSDADGDVAAYLNFTPLAGDNSRDQIVRGRDALSTRGMHCVAASFGAATLALYVDGELAAQRSDISGSLGEIDDGNVWIGRANFPEDELDGVLHEFRIYDKALSAAELRASFEAGTDPDR